MKKKSKNIKLIIGAHTQGMYVNGKLMYENNKFNLYDILDILKIKYETLQIDDYVAVQKKYILPYAFNEIPKDMLAK